MSYSNTSGGTLTIPSPTHVHHVDVGAAVVRSLRRSLSRSPSKFNLARTASHSSSGSSAQSPQASPAELPCSPSKFAADTNQDTTFPTGATSLPQTPSATPFSPSIKLSLRSAKPKAASARPFTRTRLSPKSPLKRPLNTSPDTGNPPPRISGSAPVLGQENNGYNNFALSFSASARSNLDKPSRHSMHLDLSGSSKTIPSKFLDAKSEFLSPTASPLKRSDAKMDFDHASFGSPVAKRRSLHGISSLGNDFSIFDQSPQPAPQPQVSQQQSFDIHEDGDQEYQLTGSSLNLRDQVSSPAFSMPKRTSSLRKSTLQQRHDPRSSWGRRQGEKYLAQQSNETSTPNPRNRLRASLDQFLQPDPRDSPFTSRGPLPNPSAHAMDPPAHRPHPLSRSLTTSSSNSSVPDESPTHFPIQFGDRPRPMGIFAKSLPLTAQRPKEPVPVSTPQYKTAKPLQSVFASTGLVSKMNRNPELDPAERDGGKAMIMPDTPCKKQMYSSNTYPPSSGSGGGRKKQPRHSFGTPSTPFSTFAHPPRGTFGNPERGVGLFKLRSDHVRRDSLFSLDGDVDIHCGIENELPPTPTKSVLGRESSGPYVSTTPVSVRRIPPPTSAIGRGGNDDMSELSSSPLDRIANEPKSSPKTPRDVLLPLDPSRLSISNAQALEHPASMPPATPTAGRDSFMSFAERRTNSTPVNGPGAGSVDDVLRMRFESVEMVGKGEFSEVFRVESQESKSMPFIGSMTPCRGTTTPASMIKRVYAVKKTRMPFLGQKDRASKLREVEALQAVKDCENVLQYVDSWEQNHHLYIQTEYCDEGSLDKFLKMVGESGRLDDFRIWKIMLEVAQGLRFVHDAGFVHLDLKPANILVNYEGHLKIGDFGMAVSLPAPEGVEGEGDREYIGPEILRGEYDRPADIYALGLIVLEIACNVFLPDNGPTWVALREGDMSVVPSLTGSESSALVRDGTGMPIANDVSPLDDSLGCFEFDGASSRGFPFEFSNTSTHNPSNLFGTTKRSELQTPPAFMTQASDAGSLDSIVGWMIHPNPASRPTVHQLLDASSLQWVFSRRRAPATIFEGNWGPADQTPDVLVFDADSEMTDV